MSSELIPYFITVFALAIYPGPTVLGVVSLSVQGDRFNCVKFIMGILIANTLFVIFAAFIKSSGFFLPDYLKPMIVIIGSLGLFYLGAKMAFGVNKARKNRSELTLIKFNLSNDSFLIGFFHHASNPNTITFFLSMFLSIVPLDESFFKNVLVLGAFAILIDAIVLSIYFMFAASIANLAFDQGGIVMKLPYLAVIMILYISISNFLNAYLDIMNYE